MVVLTLVGLIGLCLLVGASGVGIAEQAARGWYLTLRRPAGLPPGAALLPAWGLLSALDGTAAWLVWRLPAWRSGDKHRALQLWGWQLLLTALWTPAFFGLHSALLGLVVAVALVALGALTVVSFVRLRLAAGLLMVPALAAICYAVWISFDFWWLNRG